MRDLHSLKRVSQLFKITSKIAELLLSLKTERIKQKWNASWAQNLTSLIDIQISELDKEKTATLHHNKIQKILKNNENNNNNNLIDVNMHFIHVWNNFNQLIHISLKNNLEKIIEMKEKQCYYIDSDSHDLTVQKPVKDDESNMLKSDKTIIAWQNSEILFNIIKKNIDISFRIQIHQNMNLNLIDQIIARYSDVWSEIR